MRLINFFKKTCFNIIIIIFITASISFALYLIKKPTSCYSDKKKMVYDDYSPQCTISGEYLPYQSWNTINYTWCVTNDGIIIPDTYMKIAKDSIEINHNYNNLRFEECLKIRNNLNISQRMIVIMGKIFNPYVS